MPMSNSESRKRLHPEPLPHWSPDVVALIEKARAEAWDEACDAVLARADDGIEFGPQNYLLLRRIVRDVRAEVTP